MRHDMANTEMQLDVAFTAVHAAANQARTAKDRLFQLQENVMDGMYGDIDLEEASSQSYCLHAFRRVPALCARGRFSCRDC